jgi:ATP-dependent Clp protease ATP-binding subunit ClpX
VTPTRSKVSTFSPVTGLPVSRTDDSHPDEFPGHYESIHQSHQATDADAAAKAALEFYIPEDPTIPHHTRIDKSNLLLIGPTGVGKTYILEYASFS